MHDLLFPATDSGVLAQLLVIAAAAITALVVLRRQPEWRTVVVGLWLVGYGAIGLRALH